MEGSKKKRLRKFTRRAIARDWKRNRILYLMLLPMVVFFIVFAYLPMLHVAFVSFSDAAWVMNHSGMILWPHGFTLEGYKLVFGTKQLWQYVFLCVLCDRTRDAGDGDGRALYLVISVDDRL